MVSRPLLASSDEDDEHAATLVEVAKLGSLKIGAQLGTGAFAHVFAATHASLGRVAVKVLLDTHRGSTVARRCFTREALIMSQISHRSIVKAYGLHRIPASSPGLPPANGIAERWMMLLECCDGGSLARLLVKQMKDSWQPAYSQGQALQWLADVAEGLAHLHQQKRPLVHRDIKLENIMLHNSKELKRKVAKITDLGLHIRLGSEGRKSRHSRHRYLRLSTPTHLLNPSTTIVPGLPRSLPPALQPALPPSPLGMVRDSSGGLPSLLSLLAKANASCPSSLDRPSLIVTEEEAAAGGLLVQPQQQQQPAPQWTYMSNAPGPTSAPVASSTHGVPHASTTTQPDALAVLPGTVFHATRSSSSQTQAGGQGRGPPHTSRCQHPGPVSGLAIELGPPSLSPPSLPMAPDQHTAGASNPVPTQATLQASTPMPGPSADPTAGSPLRPRSRLNPSCAQPALLTNPTAPGAIRPISPLLLPPPAASNAHLKAGPSSQTRLSSPLITALHRAATGSSLGHPPQSGPEAASNTVSAGQAAGGSAMLGADAGEGSGGGWGSGVGAGASSACSLQGKSESGEMEHGSSISRPSGTDSLFHDLVQHLPSQGLGQGQGPGPGSGQGQEEGRGQGQPAWRQVKEAMAALSAQEWQWVYALTGQTGSCIYMAPEVQRCEPYNQAADTFSFGVLAYELLSRSMLVFTHLGGGMLPGVLTPEDYAARVADGYRPERPQSMTDDRVWELVSSCWAADPNTRPAMTTVAQALQVLAAQQAGLEEAEAAQRQGSRGLLAQCGLCHIQ